VRKCVSFLYRPWLSDSCRVIAFSIEPLLWSQPDEHRMPRSEGIGRNYRSTKKGGKVRYLRLAVAVSIGILSMVVYSHAQQSHDQMKGMDMPMKHPQKMPDKSTLQPAQGASVKIISPKPGEVIKGNKVVLQFKLVKGKRGEHVHAYVDGELVGMFQTEKGTLNGIKPGQHTLELRVATDDHKTELAAMDEIKFTTK
jgi:hypothetical protein